jgi:hypothetical protein
VAAKYHEGRRRDAGRQHIPSQGHSAEKAVMGMAKCVRCGVEYEYDYDARPPWLCIRCRRINREK